MIFFKRWLISGLMAIPSVAMAQGYLYNNPRFHNNTPSQNNNTSTNTGTPATKNPNSFPSQGSAADAPGQGTGSYNRVNKVSKIIIDAGHGGKDVGAKGTYSYEKDIALSIALKVNKLLNDSLPSVTTILTRDSDFFVPLSERHEIANRANGDLFVAIHVNSTMGHSYRVQSGTKTIGKGKRAKTVPVYETVHDRSTEATGVETWVLGLNRNGQKEKAIGKYGENVADEAGTLDPKDPTTAILISQYSQAYLAKSISLARLVQDDIQKIGRPNLGVKQKGLEVLAGSAMPGVLIEVGFINNTKEEQYLNSELGQNETAWAIFTAIRSYKREIERQTRYIRNSNNR